MFDYDAVKKANPLFGKKLDYFHLKNFLTYNFESYLKQLLTPPWRKSLLLTVLRIIDSPLKFAGGWLSQPKI